MTTLVIERVERALAILALVLGGLAAISGAPTPQGRLPLISALDLARAIRDRHGGAASPWVLDLRSQDDWAAYHVPTAKHAGTPVAPLPDARERTIVLYADAPAPLEAAAASLRTAGYVDVVALDGGLQAWLAEVMSPHVSSGDSEIGELSRYFGGMPRALGASEPVVVRTRPSGGGC